MNNRRNVRMFGALTAAALLFTACGGDDGAAADSDEPIRIGGIMDQSGATGDVGAPYSEGMVAYVDQLNENGGINGRTIDADVNDYAYEIPQAEDLYRRYVNDEVIAVMGWGTGDTEALRTRVANDELPFISGSFSEELTDVEESPYNFLIAPTYSDQIRVALNHIDQESDGEARVAVLHNDSPFGTSPVGDGSDWVEEQGLEIDYSSHPIPSGTTNFTGLLNQVSDADYIIVQDVAAPASQLARDIESQGSDQTMVCLNWCSSELLVTSAGDAAEGHMMIQPVAPLSAEKPGHEQIVDYLEEAGGDPDEVVSYVQGWYAMHVMAEGIRHTLDQDQELTGANIRESLETMGPIDTGEVIGDGTVEFSTDSHRGTVFSGIYVVEDGEIVEVEAGVEP